MVSAPLKRVLVLLSAALLALGGSACASTTNSYKGANQAIAQVISDLQTEGTANEAQKICSTLLASAVTARLESAPGGCTRALKGQLQQVDTPTLTLQGIKPEGATSASAVVKSTYAGNKNKLITVSLVKEAGGWKISKLG